jgi:hypothetical protein
MLVFVAPTVIMVLPAEAPETVEGEKLQLQPTGKPVHENETEALNPFSGVTDTLSEPELPALTERALAESARPKSGVAAGAAAFTTTVTEFDVAGASAASPL